MDPGHTEEKAPPQDCAPGWQGARYTERPRRRGATTGSPGFTCLHGAVAAAGRERSHAGVEGQAVDGPHRDSAIGVLLAVALEGEGLGPGVEVLARDLHRGRKGALSVVSASRRPPFLVPFAHVAQLCQVQQGGVRPCRARSPNRWHPPCPPPTLRRTQIRPGSTALGASVPSFWTPASPPPPPCSSRGPARHF